MDRFSEYQLMIRISRQFSSIWHNSMMYRKQIAMDKSKSLFYRFNR